MSRVTEVLRSFAILLDLFGRSTMAMSGAVHRLRNYTMVESVAKMLTVEQDIFHPSQSCARCGRLGRMWLQHEVKACCFGT